MEELIQVIMVIILMPLGMSMAVRPKIWANWLQTLQDSGTSAILSMAIVYLFFGAFIITFHWVWEGFATVVTVYAILVIIRSIMMLFFPEFELKMIDWFKPKIVPLTSISGFVIFIIAATLYHELEVKSGILAVPETMFNIVMLDQ